VTIRLSQTAPWNSELTNPYRTRYAEVDGRYFKVSAINLQADWDVEEITADDVTITYITFLAPNLAAARLAITACLEGKSDDEIFNLMMNAPKTGTGRNAPTNVERRAAWRR
jgi:hypothetical protein